MRVVLDTNILISSFFYGGLPRQVYNAALQKQYRVLYSDALTAELRRVLAYEKFRDRLARTSQTIDDLVEAFSIVGERVNAATVPENVVRDRKDSAIIACAVGGRADYIVTGDLDVLTLEHYEGVHIVTPADFLDILGRAEGRK